MAISKERAIELTRRAVRLAKEKAEAEKLEALSAIRSEFYVLLHQVIVDGKIDFSLWHVGESNPTLSVGKEGDLFLNANSGDIFLNTSGKWELALNIKPKDGKDGKDGADGKDGSDGRDGKNGKNGKDGRDGSKGEKGDRGPQGLAGKNGKNGKDGTRWFSSRREPKYDLGKVGDFYINSDNGDYFEKTSTLGWTRKGNLRGPSGPAGYSTGGGEGGGSGEGATALSELTDVNLAGIADGKILQYDSGTSKWVVADYNAETLPIDDTDISTATAGTVTGSTVTEIILNLVTAFGVTISNILNALGNMFDKTTDTLDDITEGSTNKHFTSTLKTKLDGLPTSAIDMTLIDAEGDLIVGDSDNTAKKLPIGERGSVLSPNASGELAYSQAIKHPVRVPVGGYLLTTRLLGTGYAAAGNSSTASNSNNRFKNVPFMVDEITRIDRIALYVIGTNDTGSLRLGIYEDDGNGGLGAVVADGGLTSIASAGIKTQTVDAVLYPDKIYHAVAMTEALNTAGGNPTFASTGASTAATAEDSPAASNNMFAFKVWSMTTGGFTASPTPPANSRSLTTSSPHIWIRRATL